MHFLIKQIGILNVHIINIPEQYLQYLTSRYGNSGSKVAVVFDGYDHIHSTKSVQHTRRIEGVIVAPDIKVGNL